MRYGGWEVQ
jgi:hypothetical protein